jgi:hypothetical protein
MAMLLLGGGLFVCQGISNHHHHHQHLLFAIVAAIGISIAGPGATTPETCSSAKMKLGKP